MNLRWLTLSLGLAVMVTSPAWAGPIGISPVTGTYSTGGQTTGTGPWTMTATDSSISLLTLTLDSPVAFNQLVSLGVQYEALQGGIGGGAPRFAFRVDSNNDGVVDGQFLLHWGPPGTFSDPTLGQGDTGNLLALTDNGRYDLGGIGGSIYTDRAAALALAGDYNVHQIRLILDSFGGNDREFLIGGPNGAGFSVTATPEPTSLAVAGVVGLAGLAFGRRRRKR